MYPISDTSTKLPGGSPTFNSLAILRRLKISIGGMYVMKALVQHTIVVFTPLSPLDTDPTCRFPFLASTFWHLFWTMPTPDSSTLNKRVASIWFSSTTFPKMSKMH